MVRGMPDQSSASTEHALIQEINAPLATLPDDPLPAVQDVEFPIVLRGYDRDAVDAYVRRTSQLVTELQASHSPDAAVRRALERVGEEVSGILQRAHDTAAQITAQSRSEAEDRLETSRREAEERLESSRREAEERLESSRREAEERLAAAHKEAARIVASSEQRLRDLDAETDRIWGERLRIVDDARELARELLALTESAAERFPAATTTEGELSQAAFPIEDAVADDEAFDEFDREYGEPDPDVEPTAVMPAVDPADIAAYDASLHAGAGGEWPMGEPTVGEGHFSQGHGSEGHGSEGHGSEGHGSEGGRLEGEPGAP